MNRKPSKLVIFLSVFIDLIGFGIVLPLLPRFADDNFRADFTAKDFVIGAIIASFSAMQFFFAPVWGRLSDRIGRRPVMLVSNLGAAGSYVLFAIACTMSGTAGLWMILVSRLFAGICGANLSVASAYIADISPPDKRSAGMGLIGMAFGLGFILGPALGAFSIDIFKSNQAPGWIAAAFCAGNFVLGWFILGESRKPDSEPVAPRPKFTQWSHTLSQPKLGALIGIFFLATFCFTCFESTFTLLIKHGFPFMKNGHHVGYLFAYCGLIQAMLQGGLIGRLVKKFGEQKLIFISLLILAAGLASLPFQKNMTGLLVSLALLAIGSGLNRPPLFGLLSLNSPANEQGANLGVAQSFGSLARIFGPIFAGSLLDLSLSLPYVICSVLAVVTALITWQFLLRATPAAASAQK
jgi:MFS family permease